MSGRQVARCRSEIAYLEYSETVRSDLRSGVEVDTRNPLKCHSY
jgi:hypothetical protein